MRCLRFVVCLFVVCVFVILAQERAEGARQRREGEMKVRMKVRGG